MKKHLGLVLACLIPFYQVARSAEPVTYPNNSLVNETPAEIVGEVLKDETLYKRDVVNAISRFDEYKRPKRERYSEHGLLEGFLTAFEDELNEDRFFYVGEDYDENDFIFKNQALSAAWDVLVANYLLFGKIDDTITTIKKETTIETPARFPYRVKLNPELDRDDYLRIRVRLRSKNGGIFNNMQLRFSRDSLEIGKQYPLDKSGKGATFGMSLLYDYSGEYVARAELKFPWWFSE